MSVSNNSGEIPQNSSFSANQNSLPFTISSSIQTTTSSAPSLALDASNSGFFLSFSSDLGLFSSSSMSSVVLQPQGFLTATPSRILILNDASSLFSQSSAVPSPGLSQVSLLISLSFLSLTLAATLLQTLDIQSLSLGSDSAVPMTSFSSNLTPSSSFSAPQPSSTISLAISSSFSAISLEPSSSFVPVSSLIFSSSSSSVTSSVFSSLPLSSSSFSSISSSTPSLSSFSSASSIPSLPLLLESTILLLLLQIFSSSSLSWISSIASSTEISSTSESSSDIPVSSSSFGLSLALITSSTESSETELLSLVIPVTLAPTSSHTPSSSGKYSVSTVSVLPNTTITTLVTIPTAATAPGSGGSSVSQKNGRIIGGVVGAVGGALLLGALALLVFLKRRGKNVTNQLPDFADDALASDTEKGTGFLKIFGAKAGSSGGGVSTYNGLENQINVRSASMAGAGLGAGTGTGNGDGFEYRGVTNSNNLDSVFRSTATNTATGPTSLGQNTAHETPHQGPSRYNSMRATGMGTMHETERQLPNASARYSRALADAPYPTHEGDIHSALSESDKLSEYATDEDFLFHGEPHLFWTQEHHSNNSRLRFTEDLG